MTAALSLIAAWACAMAGHAMIACANRARWRAATGSALPPAARRRCAGSGAAMLLLSVALAVVRDGWGKGLLLAPLVIATGLAVVVVVLAVRPGLLRGVARLAGADRCPPPA